MMGHDRFYYSLIVRVTFVGEVRYHVKVMEWPCEPYQLTIQELRMELGIADSSEWIGRSKTPYWTQAKKLVKQIALERKVRLHGGLLVHVHPAFAEVEMHYYDYTAPCQVIYSDKFIKRSRSRQMRVPAPA